MESAASSMTDVDVIILESGPSGLALATLLTRQGLRMAAVDKHRIVGSNPRVPHIDDEVARSLQPLGIAEKSAPESTESGDLTVYGGDWQPFMQLRLPLGKHRSQPDGARSATRTQVGAATLDLNGTQRSLILNIFPFVRGRLSNTTWPARNKADMTTRMLPCAALCLDRPPADAIDHSGIWRPSRPLASALLKTRLRSNQPGQAIFKSAAGSWRRGTLLI